MADELKTDESEHGEKQAMEQLIAENKTLKEDIRLLSDIVEKYDKELSASNDMLEKITNVLEETRETIDRLTAKNVQVVRIT